MQFGVPNCDSGSKTCHCSEGSWIRGSRGWGETGAFRKELKAAYGQFFKNGTFPASIKSWEEMEYNKFNIIGGANQWTQDAILNWSECDILDQVHEDTNQGLYTWGYKKSTPNGPTA